MAFSRRTYRTARFNQGAFLRQINAPANWQTGVCHALSMSWCNQYLLAPDAQPTARVRALQTGIADAGAMQMMMGNRWDNEGGGAATQGMARFFRLTMQTERRITSGQMLYNIIRHETNTPMILSMSWENGAHSVALHRKRGGCFSTGRIRFFDPNFGEYRIKMSQFASWYVGWLLQQYAPLGALERIDVRTIERYAAPAAVRGGVNVMFLPA